MEAISKCLQVALELFRWCEALENGAVDEQRGFELSGRSTESMESLTSHQVTKSPSH